MTVKEAIEALKTAKYRDVAEIAFIVNGKRYEIESIGQYGFVPDVNVYLEEINEPIIKPVKVITKKGQKALLNSLKSTKNNP